MVFGCSYSPVDVEGYEYKASEKSEEFSQDGVSINKFISENRTTVELNDMPKNLINGIVAIEDARFYKHKGYDPTGMLRALYTNIKSGGISEGASTITQQLARNLFKEITTDQTVMRKINEIFTARQLEKKYTKDQILEMYLNKIYLGSGTYGVQEASKEYFGKDVTELTLAECAMLAGLPQAPSAYAPDEHFELAKKRQETVLHRMVTGEYITQEEADAAKKEEVIIIDEETKESKGTKEGYRGYVNQTIKEYQKILQEKYPRQNITKQTAIESLENDGLKIYTTINSKMQEFALSSLNQEIKSHGLQNVATGSLVTVDATTGAVLAYYGGNTQIDMANEPRQPGSTIKPFIYAKAFEDKVVTANSLIKDEPLTINRKTYTNADNRFRGYITIREAIVNSVNIPAVKMMKTMGVDKTIDYIKKFGITSFVEGDYGLHTSLGGMTYGVSPLQMAKGYGVFANGGVKNDEYFIESITDRDDNIIYKHESSEDESKQVISSQTASEIKDVLIEVVNRGTATGAKTSYETAGKTGTTTDYKDLWFVGFTGKIVSSVWLGNLDNKPLNAKSSYSAEIYGDYLNKLIQNNLIAGKQLQKIETPNGMITIPILSPSIENNFNGKSIPSDQVITVTIPRDQVSYFEGKRVVGVQIDKESGKVFVEGKCPEKNKELKYYILGQEPVEICDQSHFLNKVEDFFNRKENQNKENQNKETLDEENIDEENIDEENIDEENIDEENIDQGKSNKKEKNGNVNKFDD